MSTVQFAGAFLRLLQQQFEKHEQTSFSLKTALLASGNYAFADLFTEWAVDDDGAAKQMFDAGDASGTQGAVYKFTEDDITPEEAEMWIAKLAEQEEFTLSGDDFGENDRAVVNWGT